MYNKVFVSYVYYEKKSQRHRDNLRFFIQEGIQGCDPGCADVYLSINGHRCDVKLPDETPNFKVYRRENTGFDFGAHAGALKLLLETTQSRSFTELKYDAFVFLNGSQRGPFLPSYWPKTDHWSKVFTNRMTQNALVGSSQFFHPNTLTPTVETWAFALRPDAMQIAWDHKGIFREHPSKHSAVCAENALTPLILKHNLKYCSLLLKYNTGKDIVQTNQAKIPSRPWSYEGISIHPLETVFYKTFWDSSIASENLYDCPFEVKYTQWKFGEPEGSRPILHFGDYYQQRKLDAPISKDKKLERNAASVSRKTFLATTITLATVTAVLLFVLVFVMLRNK